MVLLLGPGAAAARGDDRVHVWTEILVPRGARAREGCDYADTVLATQRRRLESLLHRVEVLRRLQRHRAIRRASCVRSRLMADGPRPGPFERGHSRRQPCNRRSNRVRCRSCCTQWTCVAETVSGRQNRPPGKRWRHQVANAWHYNLLCCGVCGKQRTRSCNTVRGRVALPGSRARAREPTLSPGPVSWHSLRTQL